LWDTAFRGSILREVSFDQAYLPSADFTGAKVDLQELEAAYAPWAVVPGGILQPWGAELVREGRAGFEDVRRRRLTRLSGAGLIRELHLADAYRATQPGGRDN